LYSWHFYFTVYGPVKLSRSLTS